MQGRNQGADNDKNKACGEGRAEDEDAEVDHAQPFDRSVHFRVGGGGSHDPACFRDGLETDQLVDAFKGVMNKPLALGQHLAAKIKLAQIQMENIALVRVGKDFSGGVEEVRIARSADLYRVDKAGIATRQIDHAQKNAGNFPVGLDGG